MALVQQQQAAQQMSASGPTTLTALPDIVNLELYRGDDFQFTLVVTNQDGSPADLSGFTATAQVRISAEDAGVAGTITAVITGNNITCSLAHTISATLPNAAVWDCQLTSAAGKLTTIVAGDVTMTADVTRP